MGQRDRRCPIQLVQPADRVGQVRDSEQAARAEPADEEGGLDRSGRSSHSRQNEQSSCYPACGAHAVGPGEGLPGSGDRRAVEGRVELRPPPGRASGRAFVRHGRATGAAARPRAHRAPARGCRRAGPSTARRPGSEWSGSPPRRRRGTRGCRAGGGDGGVARPPPRQGAATITKYRFSWRMRPPSSAASSEGTKTRLYVPARAVLELAILPALRLGVVPEHAADHDQLARDAVGLAEEAVPVGLLEMAVEVAGVEPDEGAVLEGQIEGVTDDERGVRAACARPRPCCRWSSPVTSPRRCRVMKPVPQATSSVRARGKSLPAIQPSSWRSSASSSPAGAVAP